MPESSAGPAMWRVYLRLPALARRYAAPAGIFLANFGLAKAAAYIGPLLLAGILAPDVYGAIEFSWSSGMLAATILCLGVPSALPQLLLLRRPTPAADILAALVVVSGALALVLTMLLTLAGGAPVAALVINCFVLALAQGNASAYARTRSYRNWAVWVEHLATHVVVFIALLAGLGQASAIRVLAAGTTGATALLTLGATVILFRYRAADFSGRIRTAIRLGLPLLVYSLCSTWIVVSGRIYIGATLGAEDLAAYSVSFRLGSAILIVHAILATALFARLYRLHARQYDRYLAVYQVLIAASCILLILLYPLILERLALRAIDMQGHAESIAIFPIVLLQIFGWNAWATLEMRVARARRGGQAAWRTLLVFACFGLLLAILVWTNALTLRATVWLVAAQVVVGVAVQLHVLWRRGLKMPRTSASLILGAAAILAAGWAVG